MIDLKRIPDWWRRTSVIVRDFPLALMLAVVSLIGPFVPSIDSHGTTVGDLPDRPFGAAAVVVILVECAGLVIRRRWPVACLAVVSSGFAVDQLYGYHTVSATAIGIALLSAGAHVNRHRYTVIACASVAYVAFAVGLDRQGSTEGVEGFLTFYVVAAIVWAIGAWLRQSRIAEAERRRFVAEATRQAERTRIARELHDVVTHHVTAMVVQTEAARYLTANPERLDTTLSAVTDTGRRAITDLRHLLDLLNPEHGTEPRMPSVGELHTLVEQTRQAGQPVDFTEDGSPQETAGSAEIAAYRVVQEALTNVLKYAHGSHTVVNVHHSVREITVEVSNDGSGSRAGSPGGSGRGLTGLRERVDVLGGEFSAGGRPGGGFIVRARIPAGSRA